MTWEPGYREVPAFEDGCEPPDDGEDWRQAAADFEQDQYESGTFADQEADSGV